MHSGAERQASFISGPNGRLAYHRIKGAGPGVVWLGGFKSDMTGTKASFLANWAEDEGRAFLRFDYSGHGASAGEFEDGGVSDWTADALAAFDALTEGPQILVGSSMGGWIAALLALKRASRVAAIVFVAPAPDFTEELMWKNMSGERQQRILREGRVEIPSDDDYEPIIITNRLIEDGRMNLILGEPIAISVPVRILHGLADADVPWTHSVRFANALTSNDVIVTLIKNGDHNLSTPADLQRLRSAICDVA